MAVGHFSSGHDLGTDEERVDAEQRPWPEGARGVLECSWTLYVENSLRWRELPKPTIASVQGYCIYGGFLIDRVRQNPRRRRRALERDRGALRAWWSSSPRPCVALNRAVAVGRSEGPKERLALLEEIRPASAVLESYAPWHAALSRPARTRRTP